MENIFNKALKAHQLFEDAIQRDDFQYYIDFIVQLNDDELREFVGNNKWELINIVFCHLLYKREFSEDFIRENFIKLTVKEKELLEQYLFDEIYFLACEVEEEENYDSAIKILDKINLIKTAHLYIKFCKPQNEKIINEYNFIIETFYASMIF